VDAGQRLLAYDWPRNVRELEKCLTRAVLFAGEGAIEVEHLPPEIREPAKTSAGPVSAEEEERARLDGLLKRHRGNTQAVADELGTSRSQIHRLVKKYGLVLAGYRR
jgi:transcriptional regulator of acetoin/glycerol metabolism